MILQNFRPLLVLALSTGITMPVLHAQMPVDIGLQRNGDALEVVVRPGTDVSGILSSLVFTLRWEKASDATLGEVAQEGAAAVCLPVQRSGNVREQGPYRYQVYAGFGTTPLSGAGTSWTASKEYVVASIPVSGTANFELVNDAWTNEPTNNADFYFSLGGKDVTGIIYKSLATTEGEGGVTISPNPNNGIFSFSFAVGESADITVEVVNALGQTVFNETIKEFTGTYRKDMDLTGSSSGLYQIKVKRGEQTSTHKVIYR